MFGRKARRIKQLENDCLVLGRKLMQAFEDCDDWTETAGRYAEGVQYYSGLLDLIAEHFGVEAYRRDDGSFSADPLHVKIPDLVSDLARRLHYYKNQHPVIEAEFILIEAVNP